MLHSWQNTKNRFVYSATKFQYSLVSGSGYLTILEMIGLNFSSKEHTHVSDTQAKRNPGLNITYS